MGWRLIETLETPEIVELKRGDYVTLGFKCQQGIFDAKDEEPSSGWTHWRRLGGRDVIGWAKEIVQTAVP